MSKSCIHCGMPIQDDGILCSECGKFQFEDSKTLQAKNAFGQNEKGAAQSDIFSNFLLA